MARYIQRALYLSAFVVMAGALVLLARAANKQVTPKRQTHKGTNVVMVAPPLPPPRGPRLALAIVHPPPPPPKMTNVTLRWLPADMPAVYFVYYGTNSGLYQTKVSCGTNLQTTLALIQQKAYYFAVTAANSALVESQPSAEISWMCGTNIASGRLQFYAKAGTTTIEGWNGTPTNWSLLFGQRLTNAGVITFTEAPRTSRIYRYTTPK